MNKLEELWGKQGQVFSEIDFVLDAFIQCILQ